MSDVKRRYNAPSRVASAADTRRAVIRAATELFLDRGYVATTVSQIAERANVSRPTVFAVGNKPELFARVRDQTIAGDDEPAPIISRPAWQKMLASPDPRTTLLAYARIASAINRRYAALHEVLQRSAAAAPEMAALYERGEHERRLGAASVVHTVAAKGLLTMSTEAAIDTLWVLNAPDTYHRLVHRRGWTHRRFVEWFGNAAVASLLRHI